DYYDVLADAALAKEANRQESPVEPAGPEPLHSATLDAGINVEWPESVTGQTTPQPEIAVDGPAVFTHSPRRAQGSAQSGEYPDALDALALPSLGVLKT
ncbi:MAG: hypothetical protein ACLFVW_06460, partial [Phycisphaerae bacterium]